jgi:hypothetical protein
MFKEGKAYVAPAASVKRPHSDIRDLMDAKERAHKCVFDVEA